ncbi:MAG: biopolymer transporter ExbD [Chitinophagales bacterium]
MADFEAGDGGGHGKGEGKIRSKKMSTRVDLTPMVDLAFLLISFFMLTTTLNKPKAMQLNMPKKDDQNKEKTDVRECQVLNLLMDSNDLIWYYEGLSVAGLQKTNFAGDEGVRKQILRKQKAVSRECGLGKDGKPRDLIVLIKMLKGSKYKNMVDILDEMDITQTKIYAIQAPDPIELEAVANGGTVREFAREGANP